MKYLVMLFLLVACIGCNRTGWECISCDREIAKEAETCPHCGRTYSQSYPQYENPGSYPRKVGELHPYDEGYDAWKEAREGGNTYYLPNSNTTD